MLCDKSAATQASNRMSSNHLTLSSILLTSSSSYWQEQLDAGNFSSSVVFDPVTGFGGDGSSRGNCIDSGPFANYTNRLGPGYIIADHCIDRRISNTLSEGTSQQEVDKCLAMGSFAEAWPCIEAKPHVGGHAGVGGEVRRLLCDITESS